MASGEMKTDLVAMKTDLESSGHALGLSVSEGEVGVEQLDVEIYGFADFAEPDIFVGGMGACDGKGMSAWSLSVGEP